VAADNGRIIHRIAAVPRTEIEERQTSMAAELANNPLAAPEIGQAAERAPEILVEVKDLRAATDRVAELVLVVA
jgi:hypothetical protein